MLLSGCDFFFLQKNPNSDGGVDAPDSATDAIDAPSGPCFQEDFLTTIEPSKWINTGTAPPISYAISQDQLEITYDAGGSSRERLETVGAFDLTGATVSAVIVDGPEANTETWLAVYSGAQPTFAWKVQGGNVRCSLNDQDVFTMPFGPDFRHLRIRHDATINRMFCESSGDGNAWTPNADAIATMPFVGVKVAVVAGITATITTAVYAIWDDILVTGPNCN